MSNVSRSHEVTSNSMLKPKVTILGNFLSDTVKLCVIPSLPNTIKLPATKSARTCLQTVQFPVTQHIYFRFCCFSFKVLSHADAKKKTKKKMEKKKEKLKELRLYICIVFKRCHSSERVNYRPDHA